MTCYAEGTGPRVYYGGIRISEEELAWLLVSFGSRKLSVIERGLCYIIVDKERFDLTCDQALFSFRSVKHSGGTGETKNRAWYNSSTERLPPLFWLIDIQQNGQSKFVLLTRPSVCKFPTCVCNGIRKKSSNVGKNKKITGYDKSWH